MTKNMEQQDARFSPREAYLTKQDVRDLLRFKSIRTVERMMARGQIPFVRIGRNIRFTYDAVKAKFE